GAISNDFSGSVSASLSVNNLGTYRFNSTPSLVSDVQQWLRNPSTNFGWVLISEAENATFTVRRFASREDSVNTPVLQVQYEVPAAPVIQGIRLEGGNVVLSFVMQAGQPYTVEYRDSLNSGNWLTLTNLPPQNTTANTSVADSILGIAHRSYRVGTQFLNFHSFVPPGWVRQHSRCQRSPQ